MTGPNLHLDNTIGCFFVGMVLATILYGCTCAQVLYYLWQYPEDRMNFKLFVALLWALDTATTATHIQTIWGFLLSGHSKVEALTVMPTAGPIEWFLAATIIVIVQLYYILTIWKLVGERWFQLPITVMATLLSLLSYAFGIQDTHLIITHPALPGVFMSSKGRTASFLQPLFAAIADIYITVALTMLLRREKSEFKRTSSILRKLTVHIINRGVLTAILQSLQAILFAAYRSNGFYWSLFAFPGTRVYIISTLAVLNARRSNRLGVDSAASFSNDIQLNAVHSHRSRVYSRYTYQEQPMTPPSGASDKFIMLTTEVVHRVN